MDNLKPANVNVTTLLRRELIQLILAGTFLALLILVFAVVFLFYQAQWLSTAKGRLRLYGPIVAYGDMTEILRESLVLRIPDPASTASNVVDNAKTLDDSVKNLISKIEKESKEANLTAMLASYNSYKSSTQLGILMTSYLNFVRTASSTVFTVIRRALTGRARDTCDALVSHSAALTSSSLASRMIYLNLAKNPGSNLTFEEAVDLFIRLELLENAEDITDVSEAGASLAKYVKNLASQILSVAYQISSTPGATIPAFPHMLKPLVAMENYLSTRGHFSAEKSLGDNQTYLTLFAIGTALALLACVLTLIVTYRHIRTISRTRKMVHSFESKRLIHETHIRYVPILHELRAVSLPQKSNNEVEREYLIAARFLETIRITIPQLLFGELNHRHTRYKSDGDRWRLVSQPVRLTKNSVCCAGSVIMEIFLKHEHFRHSNPHVVPQLLAFLCTAYHIVVREVNDSGGVVIGFHNGLNITIAWNITNLVDNPAFVAVRAARAIRRRFKLLPFPCEPKFAIVSAPSMVSNTTIGQSSYSMLVSSIFGMLDKFKLVILNHALDILIDRETLQQLPGSIRTHCKAVVLLTSEQLDVPPVTAFCADEEVEMSREQSVLYNSGFALYQNNMIIEAVMEYGRYLTIYPDDKVARWLLDIVLKPKQFLVSHR